MTGSKIVWFKFTVGNHFFFRSSPSSLFDCLFELA